MILYAKAHRLGWLCAGFLLFYLAIVVLNDNKIALPALAAHGWIVLPAVNLVSILSALLAAGSLHSSMRCFEQSASWTLTLAEGAHLFAGAILAIASVGLGGLMSTGIDGALSGTRNVILYYGLALISLRVFGRTLFWITPLGYFSLVQWWGVDELLQPEWWAFPLHASNSELSWLGGFCALGLGCTAFATSPWFTVRIRTAIRLAIHRTFRVP